MKYIALIFLFISANLYSQEYLDKIAEETCDCAQQIDMENADASKVEMQLGLCILKSISEYKERLSEDYGLDLSKPNSPDMEKVGAIIGERMATICSDFFLEMSLQLTEATSEYESLTESTSATITGNIIRVSGEPFVTVYIKDEENNMVKLLWLSYFENSEDFIGVEEDMKGLNVKIDYYTMDLYDSRIDDYVPYNIISYMEIIEE